MITLASTSPARAAMLTAAGVAFDAVPARVDEEALTASLVAEAAPPERIADALAELKAVKVSRQARGLVLGADSVVVTADGRSSPSPRRATGPSAQLRDLGGDDAPARIGRGDRRGRRRRCGARAVRRG